MAMGDLERAVMTQLRGSSTQRTVREVNAAVQPTRPLAYTTVRTVLDRLAKKGLVTQEREGRAYRYFPARTREQLAADLMLDALADATEPSDRVAALQHFVGRVSSDEAAAIRAALDEKA